MSDLHPTSTNTDHLTQFSNHFVLLPSFQCARSKQEWLLPSSPTFLQELQPDLAPLPSMRKYPITQISILTNHPPNTSPSETDTRRDLKHSLTYAICAYIVRSLTNILTMELSSSHQSHSIPNWRMSQQKLENGKKFTVTHPKLIL